MLLLYFQVLWKEWFDSTLHLRCIDSRSGVTPVCHHVTLSPFSNEIPKMLCHNQQLFFLKSSCRQLDADECTIIDCRIVCIES